MAPRLQQHLVGEHLRQARLQLGMTLRTLARQTGFSPSFMSQVENGQVSPSISSMERIARAVGLTLGEFFDSVTGGEGGLIVRVADRGSLSSRWSAAEIEVLEVVGTRFGVDRRTCESSRQIEVLRRFNGNVPTSIGSRPSSIRW